jgi:hypothetical protein
MTYSWEKQYNPWDIEPDVFDMILDEEPIVAPSNEIPLDELEIDADSELEFDEEFDL